MSRKGASFFTSSLCVHDLQFSAQLPQLESTWDKRLQLNEEITVLNSKEPHKGFLMPFLQDEKRLERDKLKLDKVFMHKKWELFKQWEREPVQFIDSDPFRPAPSEVLSEGERVARTRLKEVDEQMHRLTTYYEAPASTKWKVLAAYLGLAAVRLRLSIV